MNAGIYDNEAEGMKALQGMKPWEWSYEPEGYTRQDAARDEKGDDGDVDTVSRLPDAQERSS